MSNLSYIRFATQRLMCAEGRQPLTAAMDAAGQTPDGVLMVIWNVTAGGTLDPATSALVGGQETVLRGSLAAICCEEAGRTVLRQFQEIKAGDLIVDVPPNPLIYLNAGQSQSGVMPLSGVADLGPRFIWAGNPGVEYVQAAVGEKLQETWNVAVQGQPLSGTLLLRRAT